jgi:hypothetical protein
MPSKRKKSDGAASAPELKVPAVLLDPAVLGRRDDVEVLVIRTAPRRRRSGRTRHALCAAAGDALAFCILG